MMTNSKGCTFIRNNRIIAVSVREKKLFAMLIIIVISQEIEHANVGVKNYTLYSGIMYSVIRISIMSVII